MSGSHRKNLALEELRDVRPQGLQRQVLLQPGKPIPQRFERRKVVIVVIPNQLFGPPGDLVDKRTSANIVIGVESRALDQDRRARLWQIAVGMVLRRHRSTEHESRNTRFHAGQHTACDGAIAVADIRDSLRVDTGLLQKQVLCTPFSDHDFRQLGVLPVAARRRVGDDGDNTRARQNQGFRQIVGHRLSPAVLEDHARKRRFG